MKKKSIKNLLLEKGIVSEASEAEKLVLAKRVFANGELVKFAGDQVPADSQITLAQTSKYCSRAGEKLDDALEKFKIELAGKVCADVGASTGGFTGVLLDRGASKVYAIDVARGEIAWKLRTDPRVVLLEKTNARYLESLDEPVDFVCIDVSFISVALILPNVKKWLKPDSKIVVLVKPQFEAPKEMVAEGGVITDSNVHRVVLENFFQLTKNLGLILNNACQSPIQGTHGNKEFLALLSLKGEELSADSLYALT